MPNCRLSAISGVLLHVPNCRLSTLVGNFQKKVGCRNGASWGSASFNVAVVGPCFFPVAVVALSALKEAGGAITFQAKSLSEYF